MHRWVELGVIADDLVNIGRAIEKQAARGQLPAAAVKARVERSLYERANGYSYNAVKISCRPEQRNRSTRRTSNTCRRTRPRRSSG